MRRIEDRAVGHFRHFETRRIDPIGKVLMYQALEFGMNYQLAFERARHTLHRDVVMGWADAAGSQHELEALGAISNFLRDSVQFIRHDRNPFERNAQLAQFARGEVRVSVLHFPGQDLVANHDDRASSLPHTLIPPQQEYITSAAIKPQAVAARGRIPTREPPFSPFRTAPLSPHLNEKCVPAIRPMGRRDRSSFGVLDIACL